MIKEKSCGAVIYKVIDNQIYFLIERMKRGHYSLCKGHVEENETEEQTAIREIKEETNLDVKLDTSFKEIITYSPYENCIKDVVFFIATMESNEIINQECEVSEIHLYKFNKAYRTLSYQDDKDILLKAYLHILFKRMNKVILIGSPGSGKSYLTNKLKKVIDLPIYHLDLLYWYDNYKHISNEKFIEKQREIMKQNKWLIVGHYQNSIEERIKNADTIFHFNINGHTCINRLKDKIKHYPIKEDITSCSADEEFEMCILNFKKSNNPKIHEYMNKYPSNVLTIYNLKMLNLIAEYIYKYEKKKID